MDDGKAISLAVWVCVAELMIMYAGAEDTSPQNIAPPPIPNTGPLARFKSLRQVGLPAEQLLNSGDTAAIDRAAIQDGHVSTVPLSHHQERARYAAFKTPDLRYVLITGPYFPEGSQETRWDVIGHSNNKGDGLQHPYLDEDIQPCVTGERYRRSCGDSRVAHKSRL